MIINNKEYSDLLSLASDLYKDPVSYYRELFKDEIIASIKEIDKDKGNQIEKLSLSSLPIDIIIFKATYILDHNFFFAIHEMRFDDYKQLGLKMLESSPIADPILLQILSYSLLSKHMITTSYCKSDTKLFDDVLKIEQIASQDIKLAYFLLAYRLSETTDFYFDKTRYKDLYNFCYYMCKEDKDVSIMGKYLSESPLLKAYSYFSKDKSKIDEFLHLTSMLKKSEKELDDYLTIKKSYL